MTKWNPMQEKAIYTKNKNILVSASAGSGKTTVLIARLLHLVQDEKIEVNRILAMTFSEAAANEMKKRLAVALKGAIEKSHDVEEQQYLQKQLASLSNAYISTIHGFCLQIIQKYYYMISLDKERVNHVVDETTKTLLIDQCMKETFQHFYETRQDFSTLCSVFSSRVESVATLQEGILALFTLARSKNDPMAFLQACRDQKDITTINSLAPLTLTYFYDYLSVQVQGIIEHVQAAMMSYEEEEKRNVAYEKKNALDSLLTLLDKQQYETFREQFLSLSIQLLPTEKDNEIAKTAKKEVEAIENQVLSILYEEAEYVNRHNLNNAYITLFVDVCLTFYQAYEEKKEQYKYIDFNDMEHLALRILQANDCAVSKIYQQQFQEIMVDEFQDSNDVQDYLVKCICRDNNVFRVGDIKQSIYGFRHASPAIMKSLIDHKGVNDEVIYLSNNYRSKKTIIDFNNILFNDMMNTKGFSSVFTKEDHAYHGINDQEENNSPIYFHHIDKELIKETPYSKDQLKARYIANQMLLLHKEKGYAFKDMVVLVKAHAKSAFLKEAFEEAAIPHFISIKHGFYHSHAVQTIISFLKALYNPYDDIAMCATLLSPFFKKSDSDLANAKLEMEKGQSFYSYFKQQIPFFIQIKNTIHTKKMSQILIDLYGMNDFYEKLTTKQEKSNLDKLFEIVCDKEKETHVTLASFLDVLEKSQDTQIGEAIPIGNQDDVVQVMSIHQSKGLQFPVVFLYSTSTISLLDTRGIIAFDASLHIGMQYVDTNKRLVYPTVERIALNHKITKSQLEEEMRVLYVATTRAQQEMHIVDVGVNFDLPSLSQVEMYKKRGYSAWISQSLRHQAFADIQFIHADTLWSLAALTKKEKQEADVISYYKQPSSSVETTSPSESEWVNFTPREYNPYEEVAMQRGNVLHKTIELLPIHTTSLEEVIHCANNHQLPLQEQDAKAILSFYQHDLYAVCKKGTLYHEFPFMVKIEDTLSHGYIDFLSILDHEIIIIDFKSDRNNDQQEFIKRYSEQLYAYQKALQVLYPNKQIKPYLYSFHLQAIIPIQ